ncbi:GNAT family N-acetyltransferase [Vibrio algarum]|uniref:GNAT family N-acetyltransferase n=1 Tax=Vibrio algarum TaxID=3020714 RepID=A0ABT4YV06_9VIBR|nr:GNAT family N-acetyltransferase [Vibrio sp. KJ40-1]MDB1125373.1 GNAT family N-acetyltransferase [Vibrio sp. KJ40-1]
MKFTPKFSNSQFFFNPICISDAFTLFNAVSSNKFPTSLPLAKLETLKEAESWCSDRVLDWKTGKCYVWTCSRLLDSVVVGQVTLLPQEDRLALAYWVNPELWGQGIATQMCESLLFHIQSEGYRGFVWAGVHNWNVRSASVLNNLGFKKIESSCESNVEYNLLIE